MLSHRKMSGKSKVIAPEPVVTPIYQSTNFIFPDTASLIDLQLGRRKGYIYTRYGNPTLTAVEEKLARLDGVEQSLMMSSGMAAISTACLTLLKSKDEIVSSYPLYGGTSGLFDGLFKNMGIRVRYFPAGEWQKMDRLINARTKLIYLESPTNPNLQIVDLKEVVAVAKERDIFTMIDSTFATPINQKPVEFGIDAVIHSATKYLGGHSDIMGGVISGSKEFISRATKTMKSLGGCADPHQAFLLDRGVKTLEVRMARHNDNAMQIARYFQNDPNLERVIYPGLESHPQYPVAAEQMKGFGGIVTIDLGSEDKAIKFADSLKVILNAGSLGGTESLISLPIWTSHLGLDKSELAKAGVTPGMARLSIGLEDQDALIADIKQALDAASK